MNVDVQELVSGADRAARDGDWTTALRAYCEAGDCAAGYGLRRAALRNYKRALEIDLLDRETIERISILTARLGLEDWPDYRRILEVTPPWPHFGCRNSNIVIGDAGAAVECPHVGPVLDLIMTEADLIELSPVAGFEAMPLPMALMILRRALWAVPRDSPSESQTVRVIYRGRARVRLDEHGDWEAIS